MESQKPNLAVNFRIKKSYLNNETSEINLIKISPLEG